MLNERCEPGKYECSGGLSCEQLTFCLEEVDRGRYSTDEFRAVCRTAADCSGFPRSRCDKRFTCKNPAARKYEAQRIAAAKDVPANKVPTPYVADIEGAAPRYPILKDGEKRPPLPDVPEPPDDTPPPSTDPVESSDAGFATPPPRETPNLTATATPNADGHGEPPVKAPSGRGGCAGCIVGVSDRDMAGWAGLMSLLGLGIALRRKMGSKRS